MSKVRPFSATDSVKALLRRQVRMVFNDTARGEAPIGHSEDALTPRGSIVRTVHADVVSMMVGGMAALLLQMLHPAALRGVLDHSNFRQDMLGRLRRTARFIAITTYAGKVDAEAAIGRVRSIHERVEGVLPDGTTYRASDPHLLAWVHVAESLCFLDAYIRYVDPAMNAADQDLYFAEAAYVARALGADPVPVTRAEAEDLLRDYRPELMVIAETREVADLVLKPSGRNPAVAASHLMLGNAALDLLPRWAGRMLDRRPPPMSALPNRLATRALGATLRWSFRGWGQRMLGIRAPWAIDGM
ncbi:oxygenase MpaB family protein [Croceicoccus sp. F390]|uniref:Oxygenase MpaB family protein n=1 Tax=Croceicoccus esteveae TaxID=3075597 RepID=A0ABU2ZHW3_9SPHN|nr:oxygenase MpaB family protein [Croceicoccus sp. F390]MDT0576203.1 oxygenase MpaB family protein [Croceicoccus sp. F390]